MYSAKIQIPLSGNSRWAKIQWNCSPTLDQKCKNKHRSHCAHKKWNICFKSYRVCVDMNVVYMRNTYYTIIVLFLSLFVNSFYIYTYVFHKQQRNINIVNKCSWKRPEIILDRFKGIFLMFVFREQMTDTFKS